MTDEGRTLAALSVAAVGSAAGAGAVAATAASSFTWVVVRLEWAAVILMAAGVVAGSERLVAAATAPVLAGLVLGAMGGEDVAWSASLVVGALWFAAVEAGLASIEVRGGIDATPAVAHRRLADIATVIAVGISIGIVGLAAASLAPERTLAVRALVVASVLAVLAAAVRRVSSALSGGGGRTTGDAAS